MSTKQELIDLIEFMKLAIATAGHLASNKSEEMTVSIAKDIESFNEIAAIVRRESDMHNELCLKCGSYKLAHKGACDGCRWKKGEQK